jgi:ribosomal protein L37AE/L43A
MVYDYYSRVLCPFCEGGEMRAVNASLARCSGCQDTMDHGLYEAMLQIRSLPQTAYAEASRRVDPRRRGARSD